VSTTVTIYPCVDHRASNDMSGLEALTRSPAIDERVLESNMRSF